MKMRIFRSHKLWRDRAVDNTEADGSKVHWRHLDDAEFDQQLRCKLLEESEEVCTATTHDDLASELADVCDVVDALCALHNIDKANIVALQRKKYDERGGFDGRKFVETSQHPEGSRGERICLEQPHKYPEVLTEG